MQRQDSGHALQSQDSDFTTFHRGNIYLNPLAEVETDAHGNRVIIPTYEEISIGPSKSSSGRSQHIKPLCRLIETHYPHSQVYPTRSSSSSTPLTPNDGVSPDGSASDSALIYENVNATTQDEEGDSKTERHYQNVHAKTKSASLGRLQGLKMPLYSNPELVGQVTKRPFSCQYSVPLDTKSRSVSVHSLPYEDVDLPRKGIYDMPEGVAQSQGTVYKLPVDAIIKMSEAEMEEVRNDAWQGVLPDVSKSDASSQYDTPLDSLHQIVSHPIRKTNPVYKNVPVNACSSDRADPEREVIEAKLPFTSPDKATTSACTSQERSDFVSGVQGSCSVDDFVDVKDLPSLLNSAPHESVFIQDIEDNISDFVDVKDLPPVPAPRKSKLKQTKSAL